MSESYAKIAAMVQERSTLDATAFALMKWISAEMSCVMQAAIRSIIATRRAFFRTAVAGDLCGADPRLPRGTPF